MAGRKRGQVYQADYSVYFTSLNEELVRHLREVEARVVTLRCAADK